MPFLSIATPTISKMAEFVRLVLQPPFIVHTETLPGLLPLSIMLATAILSLSASLLAASTGCPYGSLVEAALLRTCRGL